MRDTDHDSCPPAPATSQSRSAVSWYHPPKADVPPRFKYGPMRGNQKLLAQAICPVFNCGVDRRQLKMLTETGDIYVTKPVGRQVCNVWFAVERYFTEASENMSRLKNVQEQARTGQKRTTPDMKPEPMRHRCTEPASPSLQLEHATPASPQLR